MSWQESWLGGIDFERMDEIEYDRAMSKVAKAVTIKKGLYIGGIVALCLMLIIGIYFYVDFTRMADKWGNLADDWSDMGQSDKAQECISEEYECERNAMSSFFTFLGLGVLCLFLLGGLGYVTSMAITDVRMKLERWRRGQPQSQVQQKEPTIQIPSSQPLPLAIPPQSPAVTATTPPAVFLQPPAPPVPKPAVAIKCPHCGADVKMRWKACPECGNKIPLYCPHCGAVVQEGWKACPACGGKL